MPFFITEHFADILYLRNTWEKSDKQAHAYAKLIHKLEQRWKVDRNRAYADGVAQRDRAKHGKGRQGFIAVPKCLKINFTRLCGFAAAFAQQISDIIAGTVNDVMTKSQAQYGSQDGQQIREQTWDKQWK